MNLKKTRGASGPGPCWMIYIGHHDISLQVQMNVELKLTSFVIFLINVNEKCSVLV